MNRWSIAISDSAENPKVDAFLEDVWRVCEKHGFAIAHEDGGGAFEIVKIGNAFREHGEREWLFDAHDATRLIGEKVMRFVVETAKGEFKRIVADSKDEARRAFEIGEGKVRVHSVADGERFRDAVKRVMRAAAARESED